MLILNSTQHIKFTKFTLLLVSSALCANNHNNNRMKKYFVFPFLCNKKSLKRCVPFVQLPIKKQEQNIPIFVHSNLETQTRQPNETYVFFSVGLGFFLSFVLFFLFLFSWHWCIRWWWWYVLLLILLCAHSTPSPKNIFLQFHMLYQCSLMNLFLFKNVHFVFIFFDKKTVDFPLNSFHSIILLLLFIYQSSIRMPRKCGRVMCIRVCAVRIYAI